MRYSLILCFFFILTSCEKNKVQNKKEVYNFFNQPDRVSENYKTVATELGKKKYELWAKRIEFFSQKRYVDILDSMIVVFENKEDHTLTRIYAHSGYMKDQTNDLKAMKNVSVISTDGKKLYTDTLYFNSKTNRLYSDTDVMFVFNEDTTWGSSFTSDTQLENIMIVNQRSVYRNSK